MGWLDIYTNTLIGNAKKGGGFTQDAPPKFNIAIGSVTAIEENTCKTTPPVSGQLTRLCECHSNWCHVHLCDISHYDIRTLTALLGDIKSSSSSWQPTSSNRAISHRPQKRIHRCTELSSTKVENKNIFLLHSDTEEKLLVIDQLRQ